MSKFYFYYADYDILSDEQQMNIKRVIQNIIQHNQNCSLTADSIDKKFIFQGRLNNEYKKELLKSGWKQD